MEDLMFEATELIFSSPEQMSSLTASKELVRQDNIRACDLSQASTDTTSVALLRSSLRKSISDRYSKAEAIDDRGTKTQNKGQLFNEPFTKRSNIDVQLLNSKLAPFAPKSSDSVNNSDDLNTATEQANESDTSQKTFTGNSSETEETADPEASRSSPTKEMEAEEEIKTDESKPVEELETCRKTVENGIKLARRHSAENIFESCSTYNLACSQVLFDKKSMLLKQNSREENNHSAEDEPSEIANHFAEGGNEIFTNSTFAEEQISLSDSFFANVNSDEFSSSNSSFLGESANSSMGQMSVNGSYSTDSDMSDVSYDRQSGVRMRRVREHKLSKKLRKKQKKSKSKDAPVYKCPKCGVSYVLSSTVAARCLHCDFWTSVEPEFLKRGKQVWNTCRVC